MKTTLLFSLGSSFLAFTSIGQMRQTEVSQGSLSTGNLTQSTYQEVVVPEIMESRPFEAVINRAPCVDTLFFEDFQSQTIPATWLNQDLDGNTDANTRPQDWFLFQDLQTTTAGDTNYVVASSSWFSPAGTANNVLIMDAVAPCANTVMRWSSAPYEGPAFMDGYEVRVSTTGTNIADFSTVLFTAAEDISAGSGTPGTGSVHTSFNGNNGVLQDWEVSLGAYDNQTIYIAFFHNSTDDNQIMIDNVFIGMNVDYNLSVDAVSTEIYYSTPLSQVTPRTFTADLGLAIGADVTTPTSNVELFQGVTSVFTDAPSAASLSAGNIVTLTTTAYTPLAIDNYTAVFTASAAETDPDLTNNIDSLEFVVSDSVYATSDLSFDGSLGIGAGTAGFLGNQYTLIANDDLTSITFVLSTPTIGDTVVGVIYDMIGATPNVIVATTDTLFITSDLSAEYTLPITNGSIALTSGDYIVGIQEGTFANVSLATNTEYYTPGNAWVFFNGSWGNNESFGFPNTYLMRANLGPVCVDPIADFSESITDAIVDFTDLSTDTDTWLWDFGDGNVSTLQNPTHTYTTNGTYTVCLIASSACGADTVCLPITICIDPIASFTESVTVATVDFSNTSTSASNATFAWDFGDGQTSTLENPSNTYAANGTYSVCLTITDTCGVNTICNSVTISTLGIEDNMINGLSLYPVPAQEMMTVANLTSGEDFKLELLNNLGQVVKVVQSKGSETIQLDLSAVGSGYYHLRVSNTTMIGTREVLIKH